MVGQENVPILVLLVMVYTTKQETKPDTKLAKMMLTALRALFINVILNQHFYMQVQKMDTGKTEHEFLCHHPLNCTQAEISLKKKNDILMVAFTETSLSHLCIIPLITLRRLPGADC